MAKSLSKFNLLSATLLMGSFGANQVSAQMIDQQFLPPDVTLSGPAASPAAAAAASGAAVPGLGGATTATAAAGASAAAAPAAAAPNLPTGPITSRGQRMNIYTPPGQAPQQPTPPVGSSGQGTPPQGANPAAAAQAGAKPNGPAPDVSHDPIAVIETNKGIITIRLFKSIAPKTVANFIELASSGFYNNLKFHRVEKGFCVQTGDPNGTGTGLYTDPATKQPRFLTLETSPFLKHNGPGVVAMARYGASPNSASCQFYITLAAKPDLDNQYSIFGGVISGMDVVNNIVIGDQMKLVSVQMP